jgi:NADPH-dependent 2,4-dienoyl-CoA reductase/sulfur reductase-like enzyme
MGGGVAAIAAVGLDLDDAKDESWATAESMNQAAADQVGGHEARIPRVESLPKGWAEGHGPSIGEMAAGFTNEPTERRVRRRL